MHLLESDGHGSISDYPALESDACHGCDYLFAPNDEFEALVDRITKRGYLIHTWCFEKLEAKLKGEEYGNVPAWTQL